MNIIKKHLPLTEYYNTETEKHQIVLHHTVASTFSSTFNWWQQDGIHVATAYIIDKDGTICEMFNPDYWSYHLGKGTTTLNNKSAIGIELVNEGPIWKKNNQYFWWDGTVSYKGEVHDSNTWWRGYRYWAKYTKEQTTSLVELLRYLTERYQINTKIVDTYKYDKELLYKNGIISHHNVRTDKTDVSYAMDLKKLNKILNNGLLNKIKEKIWEMW